MSATTATVRAGRGAVADQRQAVVVAGPEAESFLQGQLSQDISALAPGEVAWSLLLQPAGKISARLRVTRTDHEEFVLDVDGGWADVVVARLERFKLRTKCTIETMGWRSLTIVGPTAHDLEVHGVEFEVHGDWAGLVTRDVFGTDLGFDHDELVAPEILTTLRVEAGIPAMGSELDETTIPAAAGILDDSVSFTKGCYTGQELVARIDSRGNTVPRRLVGVVLDSDEVPAPESPLIADGAEVGHVTSAGYSTALGTAVCLAYASRKVDLDASVAVGDVAGTVVELPLVKA